MISAAVVAIDGGFGCCLVWLCEMILQSPTNLQIKNFRLLRHTVVSSGREIDLLLLIIQLVAAAAAADGV